MQLEPIKFLLVVRHNNEINLNTILAFDTLFAQKEMFWTSLCTVRFPAQSENLNNSKVEKKEYQLKCKQQADRRKNRRLPKFAYLHTKDILRTEKKLKQVQEYHLKQK
jgi:hypothetical protein